MAILVPYRNLPDGVRYRLRPRLGNIYVKGEDAQISELAQMRGIGDKFEVWLVEDIRVIVEDIRRRQSAQR